MIDEMTEEGGSLPLIRLKVRKTCAPTSQLVLSLPCCFRLNTPDFQLLTTSALELNLLESWPTRTTFCSSAELGKRTLAVEEVMTPNRAAPAFL